MRIDDATMLMVRLVGQPMDIDHTAHQPHAQSGDPQERKVAEEPSSFGWLETASNDLKSISEQVAGQVDHASEQVIKGLLGLKDRAMKKYRETFGKDKAPPE